MIFTPSKIADVVIFEPKVFSDNRGYFFESYNHQVFKQAGISDNFIQDNQSKSSYGTLRGLHFQTGEYAQSKLVRVLSGKILDVAVDIRPASATYGQYIGVELSSDNNKQLYIPRGFAHGFVVLSDEAIVAYKCDNIYSVNHESGIIYNDPSLNIDWQIPASDITLSQKDKKWSKI